MSIYFKSNGSSYTSSEIDRAISEPSFLESIFSSEDINEHEWIFLGLPELKMGPSSNTIKESIITIK